MKKILAAVLIVITALLSFAVTAEAIIGTGYLRGEGEAEVIRTGLYGKKLRFSDADFKSAFCITDFEAVRIDSLPKSSEGTLLIAGRRVKEGQRIKRRNIGALVFVPANNEVENVRFDFTLFEGKTENSGKCTLKFTDKINYAPEVPKESASSLSVTTQMEISAYGKMEGSDPEGDEIVFIMAMYPKNGVLDFDKQTGQYRYTPDFDFSGYDSFTYVVRDEYGNYSEPMEVMLRTVERMSDEVFSDMLDREEYNAAVAMGAIGVMSAKTVGDEKHFCPDETVTRAEFVAMAMKAYGIKADSSLKKTFFDDNADIPAALIGYIATAQRVGIINGEFKNGGLYFDPTKTVTREEAAEIISMVMGLKVADEDGEYLENESVAIGARPYVSAMLTLGIFDSEALDGKEPVTRAIVAESLYRMVASKSK